MVRKVDITGMGDELRRFFQELASQAEPYLVVEESGKPIAGIVPSWQVGRLEDQRQALLEMLRGIWARNRDAAPEEIEREVEEAVREVRGERRR